MKNVLLEILRKLFSVKNYKILAWVFIGIVMLIILIYPILDANFLYYNRETKRIDLLHDITSLKQDTIQADQRLVNEYDAILDNLSLNRSQDIAQVINFHDKEHRLAKFISGAWLFVGVGILTLFSKSTTTKNKLLNKLFVFLFCCIIAATLGFVAMIFPTVINILVNIALYQIILFFLAYTIATSFSKK